MSASIIRGVDASGTPRTILVNSDGSLPITGGGGGDATAANQASQIALETAIRDKLIELAGYTDTLEALLTTLNGYVDGLESLQTTANSTQSAISGFVDQLEGYTDGIEGNQATQIVRLEAIRDRPLIQPATARAATTRVLNTALVEESLTLTTIKKLSIHCRNSVDIRFDTTALNTVSTANFTTIRNGNEYFENELNFTGTLYFCAETIPSTVVASCATTTASPTVTSAAGAFNTITLGQAVTGTGIAANTTVVARNAAGSSVTLSQNATASGTVSLTFSGAVVRIESWQ